MDNPVKHAENYQKLPQPAYKGKVVITTTNGKGMKANINSLLDQTVRVDLLAVNVPNEIRDQMPSWLRSCSVMGRAAVDYGEGGLCATPTLLREKDADTVLIVTRPGYVYGKDFVQTVLEAYEENDKKPLITKHALIASTSQFNTDVTNSEKPLKINWHDLAQYLTDSPVKVAYSETYPSLAMLF